MGAPVISFVETDSGVAAYTLTDTNPIDFGTLQAGSTTTKRVFVKNASASVDLLDAKVTAIEHPDSQSGSSASTYDVTTFSTSQSGTFTSELSLGTITKSTSSSYFWVKWAPPLGEASGDRIWGLQISGNYIES